MRRAHLRRYRGHLAAQVFYLLSAGQAAHIKVSRSCHTSTSRTIRIRSCSNVCSIARVNTGPPTPSSCR
ncbi:hypothetical protein MSMEI_1581 [Mycolicibacterium smegmatis MC2 155]|uniref:Uncharacterized protein n=1 Tax=Mycolicibacterium smegmatis (strain ATCC 700084 / mc(2)155) TaxID=246196 RepID=I7G618_MYCS2|nr:hypothetical protein MSMEI_1581 [Mycolicibacterium smegmatis MC2 155]